LTLLLLVCWLPATAHCGLESIGLVPMDECCEKNSSGDQHADAGCKVVEDSGLKTECSDVLPCPPELLVLLPALLELRTAAAVEPSALARSEFVTHHLPQFVIQTALPIRGPSVAS
jgi:hypothetical protein